MGLTESLAKQGFRIFGPPPPDGAPKVESWLFVRRIYTRLLLFTVPMWVLIAVSGGPMWLWIALAVSAAMWLQGFIAVNVRIRRLRDVPPDR
jgi:hypothetical protein